MNLQNMAILEWCKNNSPQCEKLFSNFFRDRTNEGYDESLSVMLSIAFKAGRQFQFENPNVALDNKLF